MRIIEKIDMKIDEVKEKLIWEGFLLGCEEKTFLQSWNWGEFQKAMGNKIWRLGLFKNSGEPFSVILVVKVRAKRGTFLLVQHGPIIKKQETDNREQAFRILLDELKKIAKNEGASFIRIAPLLERNEENIGLFQGLGFKDSPMHASAYEATWRLNLSLSEEELLAKMRKTTRYLIRQALKNPDIKIIKSNKIEDAGLYNELNQAVAKHQKFVPFSLEFIKNEFDTFKKDDQALLFFGEYKDKVIAAALIIFWSNIGFYHQAALDPKYHKIPASYLLQWEAIKEAKKRGCSLYDFWGYVDPKSKHPWAGPTLFKMGFGGKPYFYVKTQDLPVSSLRYFATHLFEKLRKTKRGL